MSFRTASLHPFCLLATFFARDLIFIDPLSCFLRTFLAALIVAASSSWLLAPMGVVC